MDENKLQEFMGKLVVDMGGAAIMSNVILGEELGLYRAMVDGQPVTPEQLAERTGCNARLLREWLSGQGLANTELTALAWRAAHFNPRTMRVADGLDDRQAEACSAGAVLAGA